MKSLGITTIIAILLLFVAPLLGVKDDYKTMEYEEIGNVMLLNIEPYIKTLETTSALADELAYVGDKIMDVLSKLQEWSNKLLEFQNKMFSAIADFLKGIFETESGQTCTGDYDSGFTCGSSEGGGGGSFGGGR